LSGQAFEGRHRRHIRAAFFAELDEDSVRETDPSLHLEAVGVDEVEQLADLVALGHAAFGTRATDASQGLTSYR
jgi:hypothetical protein